MIIEMRTYTLRPGTLAEMEKRFGEALPNRNKFGNPLVAAWHTEVGPLNQFIHVWAYESFAQRTEVRGAAMKAGGWPPNTGEFIVNMPGPQHHQHAAQPHNHRRRPPWSHALAQQRHR